MLASHIRHKGSPILLPRISNFDSVLSLHDKAGFVLIEVALVEVKLVVNSSGNLVCNNVLRGSAAL